MLHGCLLQALENLHKPLYPLALGSFILGLRLISLNIYLHQLQVTRGVSRQRKPLLISGTSSAGASDLHFQPDLMVPNPR